MKLSGIVLSILTITTLATVGAYALPAGPPPAGGPGGRHMPPPRGGHMAPVGPVHRMPPPPRHRSHIGINWNYGYNYGYNYIPGCYYSYDIYGFPRMVCNPMNNFGFHISI